MNKKLTRQLLIETGLRLLDEVGLDGLTVRRLAAELGVQSPALYWHIRTKQELLDGMADAIVLAAGMGPPLDDESWQDWLARRARAYRGSLSAHRDGARVVSGATSLSAGAVELFEQELDGMVGRGFTPGLALRTITTLSHYVNGVVLHEQAGRGGPSEVRPGPTLLAAVRETGGPLGDDGFEHGLRAFIEGTAQALANTS
ncbi:TetR/AcrR family transcriptional regulator C-terminal domain-containing protein [Nonomuraea endophytica]|uniref:TetR/AcrR family transcriptional regulator C-terminal domain-containing protein n=1 Tax=Nonomuraea endophytica TaxID=714136 RepID=UPI0037CAADA5